MDIWNALRKEIASPIGPCGIGSTTSVLELNWSIEYQKSSTIDNFVTDYHKQKDLAHLYALNRACFEVIEDSVTSIALYLEDPKEKFHDLVMSELGCFRELGSIICIDTLINELYEVSNGKHRSRGLIKTPKNMEILGELSFDIQKMIENGSWKSTEKADAYMCSLTIGNYQRFDYESFIYQLSRGYDCEETINNFIPYLQKESSNRESLYATRNWYEAEILRLIQWAEIGNISVQVNKLCEAIKIKHPLPIDNNFDDSVCKYLNTPFALFRSDFALLHLKEKLTKYLFSCQLWIEQSLDVERKDSKPLLHLAKTAISAVYLFGTYRLGVDQFDKSVLQKAADYLQCNQLPDADFIPETFHFINHLELNAMAVHALWISESFGWSRSIKRIYEWIIGELSPYGVWYPFKNIGTAYTTGLMLDTISLIKEEQKVTFSMPSHKIKQADSKSKAEGSHIKDEERKTINYYNENIFAIYDQSINTTTFTPDTVNTVKNDTKKGATKKRDANATPERVKTPEEIKAQEKFTKAMEKVGFIVEDDENICFYRNRNIEPSKDLRSKLAKNLLHYLSGTGSSSLPADMVIGASGSKIDPNKDDGKPKYVIKSINEALRTYLRRFEEFHDLPDNFEIIHNDNKRDLYESRIVVIPKDKYDRLGFKDDQQRTHSSIVNQKDIEFDPSDSLDSW